jgi:hypothetical protein
MSGELPAGKPTMMRTGFVGQAGTGAAATTAAFLLCAKVVGKIEDAESTVRVDSILRRFMIIFIFFCMMFAINLIAAYAANTLAIDHFDTMYLHSKNGAIKKLI